MKIPRIIIAGTNSGCGKTTVTTGILAALVKRGLKVQPFKVGPDYIDPMFHTFVTGRHSRNLDSWMLNSDIVSHLFEKNAADSDIAVIEGVMGFYDGFGGYSSEGSTAHVAKITGSPVVLVINGAGLSLTICALLQGIADFDREIDLKGVIINNLKSESHFQLLKEIITEKTGVRVLGYIPAMPETGLSSRHLGLVQSSEIPDLREKVSRVAHQIEKTVDLDMLLGIAGEAGDAVRSSMDFNIVRRNAGPKIAVAMDKAFSFYYRDNLELLEAMGAELAYFSPLKDTGLPGGIEGLYVGGGYPEVFAGELQENGSLKEDIRKSIEMGLPAYAECGGLMYLSESIKNLEGQVFPMVGVLPGKSEMTASLQRFGYVEIETTNDSVVSKKGYRIRAHEFHYSVTAVDWSVPACFKVTRKRRGAEAKSWQCGYRVNRLLAGYPHLHFWSNTGFAERFVNSCIQYGAAAQG